jgi:hypothetical protein
MTSSSWPAGRSPSLTPRRSKARPRLPVRPTGSTPGCSPELSRRDLVPEIWLPTPGCGPSGSGPGSGCTWSATGPRSRTASTPPCWPSASRVRSATCCGAGGRQLLARLALPEPWIGNLTAALALIDDLDDQIDACEQQLRRLGADHPSVPLLMTAPGIAWVLGYTIAAEVGDITRFPSPKKLCGYTGLCPRVYQSSGPRPARSAGQQRPTLAALGADRGGHPRRPPSLLPRPLPAHQATAGSPARRQGRPGGGCPQAHRGHLAHAHPLPALCSGKAPYQRSGRLTTLV